MSVLLVHKADPNANDCEVHSTTLCTDGVLPLSSGSLHWTQMGKHHEVAQFLLEQEALPITGDDCPTLSVQ
ncbi:hypothetical protein DPMN_183837 [Dreissena polymorpha]|uniref:Uncharacterized protein n=1 Tax=Dreissena polymorpha TaxID=45954 RepID=A0A9D4DIV2_DREPO|nr:hypothetical protein DPMN_183837 [Dreissena polymorpha]